MIAESIQEQFFIDHIVLTVTDIQRTEIFYSKIFGRPAYQNENSIMYFIGDTKLFLVLPYNPVERNRFNPDCVGLNHLAVHVAGIGHLQQVAGHLTATAIEHSGIHVDKHSKKEKIWLNDPDGIRLEFFIRP